MKLNEMGFDKKLLLGLIALYQGNTNFLYKENKLDPEGIANQILEFL